jgi:predicted protein tyrosine phosphatase
VKIKVLDRETAEIISGQIEKHGVFYISITDPNKKPAKINHSEKNILRLNFYDIEEQLVLPDGSIVEPMHKEDAEKVRIFLFNNKQDIELLIVHCEAGISRSAGMAAAISKYYNKDDMYYFTSGKFCPNMVCYRLTLEELMKDV